MILHQAGIALKAVIFCYPFTYSYSSMPPVVPCAVSRSLAVAKSPLTLQHLESGIVEKHHGSSSLILHSVQILISLKFWSRKSVFRKGLHFPVDFEGRSSLAQPENESHSVGRVKRNPIIFNTTDSISAPPCCWNLTDWGRIGFSDKSCFQLYPDNQRRHVWRHPRQSADPAFPIARHTGINEKLCLSKSSLGIHITKSFSIEHVWDMMGRRLHLLGIVDDLPRQLEQTLQEIPQKTVRVIYGTSCGSWHLG
ncbi:hypothetical protein TNCV_4465581 [Trichonephila clavipes]|nr:hypothetical protein TNCV_4465581 [Trichonephila clavipes]